MKQKKYFAGLAIVALLVALLPIKAIFAASAFDSISDTMSSNVVSVAADHSYSINLPTGVQFSDSADPGGDIIYVDFDETSGFTTSGTWVAADFTLTDGTTTYSPAATIESDSSPDCTGTTGAEKIKVGVDTTTLTFAFRACAGTSFTDSVSGGTLTLAILGTSGNGVLTNPSSASSSSNQYVSAVTMDDGGTTSAYTGSLSVAIFTVGGNNVTITGTVDPSITLTLSANTCSLGQGSSNITPGKWYTCNYTTTVSTNATNGYTAYIKESANPANATCAGATTCNPSTSDGADTFDDYDNFTSYTPSSSVPSTGEVYGVFTNDSDATTIDNYTGTSCSGVNNSTTALTASDFSSLTHQNQSFATATAPVSSDATILCHLVAVSATTEAGSYQQTVTITVVGSF